MSEMTTTLYRPTPDERQAAIESLEIAVSDLKHKHSTFDECAITNIKGALRALSPKE